MKLKTIFVFVCIVFLASCATRVPQPTPSPELIDPGSLGQDLFVRGNLTCRIYGHTIDTEAIVEVNNSRMSLVVLGPLPEPWVTVTLANGDVTVEESDEVRPFPIHPRRLLGDFQLSLWNSISSEQIGRPFRVKTVNDEQTHKRIIDGDGVIFARAEYQSWPPWSGIVEYERPAQNYRFKFTPTTVGSQ